ncbi:MAG TPA: NIPSNAP family protein [Ktedonobacterales bacterium]
MLDHCPICELRRYALKPGARATLIELFDREFVETQEAEGMRIFGQFRDLDAPDSFVWLRGFSDMVTRKRDRIVLYRLRLESACARRQRHHDQC